MSKATTLWDALAQPFPDDEVKHRPGPGNRQLSYVDARTVMNRLDGVLTPESWDFQANVVDLARGVVHGRLIIFAGDRAITHEDFGYPNGNDDPEPIKSAVSDALKRCAVQVGIGRHLYTENHSGAAQRQRATQPASGPPPPSPAGDGSWVCPEHGSERVGSGRNGLYCQVRGGENTNAKGYCNYNEGNAATPQPIQPRPQTNEGQNQLPGPNEPADMQESFDQLPF